MPFNKIISIVIPVYNMELYLSRCLDSILLDKLLDKIEIIIVNDGSTDNSLVIANSYKMQFPQAVIIIDKPNGHYGSCVNAALKIASGKYFRILDADDCFDRAAFIKFAAYLQTIDADMVITNYSKDFMSGGRKIVARHSSEKYIRQLLVMHAITYRTRILFDVKYRQSEGICYTDTEYCFYPLAVIKSIKYFDVVLYRYTIGREGQTVSTEIFYKNREHLYKVIKRMLEYLLYGNCLITLEIRELLYMKIIHAVYHYYLIILMHTKNSFDDAKMKEIDAGLKKVDMYLYSRLETVKCFRVLLPVKMWRDRSIYIGGTIIFAVLQKMMLVKNRILAFI
jgi:glycosyltransferase involved in cell wall biosynthesis